MTRIDENAAAKSYVAKLAAGGYPLERAKNDGVNYGDAKEERDTEAVRGSTKSALFKAFKKMEGDDSTSALNQYLEQNKEIAYNFASKNTPCNASGHPVISQDDEWRSETEWDDLFLFRIISGLT